jgi:hypothetical protein
MLSMLSCSESSQTDGRPEASQGRPDGQLGIRLLLSCKLRRIFQESKNCLLMLVTLILVIYYGISIVEN